ncbi:hypothetical protein DID88_000341 [Monilinia fructigena]|uniref:Choline/carnitine acyltransferase domain-containing protein n=1 Tax=Monilinia fructigena TaxID=38457 RepID=A0A395IMU8_9HELO|nr:hypothetical protein DID88_000341 [Monilinia fructigena]
MLKLLAKGRTQSPVLRNSLTSTRVSRTLGMAPANARSNSSLPKGYVEDLSKGPICSIPQISTPLLTSSELQTTTKAVQEFIKPGGIGSKLQEKLIARREDPKHKNWMYEWWNDAAYLSYRDPVVPYVSYFYSHRDDRRRRDPSKRAAAISTAVLEFKKQVDSGTLEPEYMKKLPISMESYQMDVQPHLREGESTPAVGILTSENRDIWTDAREVLLKANPSNAKILKDIESASFVVCLDDAAPVTLEERAHQYWHDFNEVIAAHELRVQAYQGYGKGLIKKFKCSPDAYNRPTYESAATRRFQQGRTETCRSVSDDSVAFCKAISDHTVEPAKAIAAFRAAINSHVEYISAASDGKGVDRHLFGLKKLLEPGEELPAIYKDPTYGYSSKWFISSSQLSSEYFNGYGWSQVVDDGWGIAYMINENSIQFNVVSKGLGSERMSFYLNEAAGDIRDLLIPTLETAKAKL